MNVEVRRRLALGKRIKLELVQMETKIEGLQSLVAAEKAKRNLEELQLVFKAVFDLERTK
jgi:hypothetical protein